MADKSAKVLAKLEESLQEGDFYGALQMYRTVVKRKVDASALEEAEKLLVQGACTLSKHGKVLEAADLGDMLLATVFEGKRRPLTAAAAASIETIAASFSSPPPPAALRFVKAACRWGNHAPGEGQEVRDAEEEEERPVEHPHRQLQARLHLLAARSCAAAGAEHRPDAQKYYLQACAPTEFAAFLYGWSQDGYAGEADLFLARPVLQLLCLGNLRDANAVRDEYYRLAGAKPAAAAGEAGNAALDTPLCHFLRFLLLTVERDAAPLFKMLVDKYSASLKRDPSGDLQAYCSTIGLRFYSIQPPKDGMAAMMENMMGMLGGGAPGGRGGGGGAPGGGLPPGLAQMMAGLGGGGARGPAGAGGIPPGLQQMMAALGNGRGPGFPPGAKQ